MALSNAERQRRYRERAKDTTVRLSFPISAESAAALDTLAAQTGTTKRAALERAIHQARQPLPRNENPEHRRLFTIPQPTTSASTDMVAPSLPEPQTITGDRELDAALWLQTVCKTARDPRVLDLALDAASRIKTPAKDLEKRFADYLSQQPGAHPFSIALSTIGIADTLRQVETARERINGYNAGLAVFGSYRAAMMPTPAEQMLERTAAPLPEGEPWDWGREQLAPIFALSVNPASLTEVVLELEYWRWLGHVRWKMQMTEEPDEHNGEDPLEDARRRHVEGLLTTMQPVDMDEAMHVLEAIKAGVIDIDSVDDGKRHAEVYEHLLRSLAQF